MVIIFFKQYPQALVNRNQACPSCETPCT